jgi:SAM-dependent methyltransferase
MKQSLLKYLACPSCNGEIQLSDVSRREAEEILEGELCCRACARCFPVTRGVPRFVELDQIAQDKAATAENFGWQWQHFSETDEHYGKQFLAWIAPVESSFFAGKVVLEAGCGKGRHTLLAANWGAKDIIGVDLSSAVETAFAKTRDIANAHIIQADIYNFPLRPAFDYAFSVGVIHHLPDPRSGFLSLASKVKPGGHLSAWVYGAENNEWITKLVSPLRERLTSRLRPRSLLQLSKIPAALVFSATKLVYGPLNRNPFGKRLAARLFYNDYLYAISHFGWREQHSIVFDHLNAPTAFYIPREEFEEWWQEVGARNVVINWHTKNSWRGFGQL